MKCAWDYFWVDCKKAAFGKSRFCIAHVDVKCRCCNAEAVRSCGETMGPFVCGTELCKDCYHSGVGMSMAHQHPDLEY